MSQTTTNLRAKRLIALARYLPAAGGADGPARGEVTLRVVAGFFFHRNCRITSATTGVCVCVYSTCVHVWRRANAPVSQDCVTAMPAAAAAAATGHRQRQA